MHHIGLVHEIPFKDESPVIGGFGVWEIVQADPSQISARVMYVKESFFW
jgi:hypothetical protein